MTSEILAKDPSIEESVQTLLKNSNTIESVRRPWVFHHSTFLLSES